MDKEAIKLAIGDLTDSPAQAIGNEVNEDLIFSDDAFSSFGASAPEETVFECLEIGQIKIGTAAITSAGDLPAEFIIHIATCGFDGVASEASIIEALRDGLNKAKLAGIKSVALAEVGRTTSTIPLKRLAELLLSECLRHDDRHEREDDIQAVETVYFRLSDQKALDIFSECLRQI